MNAYASQTTAAIRPTHEACYCNSWPKDSASLLITRSRFSTAAAALLIASLAALARAQSASPTGNATVNGKVCDSEHHPLAAVEVLLRSASGTQTWKTQSDSNGAFAFSSLPAGNYTLRSEDSKRNAASVSLSLAAGQTKTADLTLTSPGLAFFDEPAFSVAGVTDTTNLGGHGSNTVVQAKSALAKATVSLSKDVDSTHPAATESALRVAQQTTPESFSANMELAKFLVDAGRSEQAKPFLARASEIERGKNSLTGPEKSGLHHLLGNVAEHAGDPVAAVREYQRAAELDPTEANIFDWGSELLLHHAPEPATEVFNHGHTLFPRSVRMLVGLGVASYIRGSYREADLRLCEASDLAPDDPVPYVFLGKILTVESAVSTEVAARIARFAERQPQNATANYYLALSLWKQRKQTDDAEIGARVQSLLEKAIAIDPTFSEAFLQLGIIHFDRMDFPQAIKAYQQSIGANPKLEQAHYRLSQAYRLSGQPEKAQQELKIFETLSREEQAEAERERSDIKQFVYTMREEKESAPAQP